MLVLELEIRLVLVSASQKESVQGLVWVLEFEPEAHRPLAEVPGLEMEMVSAIQKELEWGLGIRLVLELV